MEVTTALLQITKHVLSIYDTKLTRKYSERCIELEKMLYDEKAKAANARDHALMDNIDYELCSISKYATSLGVPKTAN